MNCKPGDLARIIDHPASRMQRCVDKIVEVVSLVSGEGEPIWRMRQPLVCGCGCRSQVWNVADALLRPIRDPGDDVPDESTGWLPAVPVCDPMQVEPTFIRLPVREMS